VSTHCDPGICVEPIVSRSASAACTAIVHVMARLNEDQTPKLVECQRERRQSLKFARNYRMSNAILSVRSIFIISSGSCETPFARKTRTSIAA
jgi:hypothetical protein